MLATRFGLALAATLAVQPAAAQSIEELPAPVYEVAADFAQQCRNLGGSPDYNPLELVKLVFFGKDWDGGGRESYMIDLSALRCPGGDMGPGRDRPECQDQSCRLVILNPQGTEGYRVDFNDMVRGWRLAGANAGNGGPDVDILISTTAGETRYGVTPSGMARR